MAWSEDNDQKPKEGWERSVLERLAFEALREQRRSRRWGVFFKLLAFGYLGLLLAAANPEWFEDGSIVDGKHTAVVDLRGVIADDSEASASTVIAGLQDAFEAKGTAGVILRINSPGGSPVQAGYIVEEIKRLRKEHPDTPLYAVITDMGASGGYYVAVAADTIYADRASLVGSIGVRMDSFGFVGALDKLGVERRLLTSGDHKGILDPFLPVKEGEVAHIQTLLDTIHQQFIEIVKQGRGERLKGGDEALFSGLFWTGEQALKLGLVDQLASVDYVAREVIGEDKLVNYTRKKDWLERFSDEMGTQLGVVFARWAQPRLL